MIAATYSPPAHLHALLMCYRLARERAWQVRKALEMETASPVEFDGPAGEAETETLAFEGEAS
jgi:hypothetical protein